MKSLVGHETQFCDGQPIEEGMIARFARSVGDDNPLYHDRRLAQESPYHGVIAPLTFVFEWNHHEALNVDEGGASIAGIPLPGRLLRGSNEYEFFQSLRPGDIITTSSRIGDVYQKKGASGALVFIVCQSRYTNQQGELLGIQRATYILCPDLEVGQ
ncbi:MAG: MaoC family dehydratase N-terminal domain-containing protein [Chloroflexota bacterium]